MNLSREIVEHQQDRVLSDLAAGAARATVSVMIVSWNTEELLSRCLRSLSADRESGLCEVIVVDNHSHDGSPDMVERTFPGIKLIRNKKNVGFAGAVNQCFGLSTGKYVLMLNSDAAISPQTIPVAVEYMEEHPDVAILGCELVFPDGTAQSSCFRYPSLLGECLIALYLSQLFSDNYWLNWDRYGNRVWDAPRDVDCVMGSCMLIRVDALGDQGLTDEAYFMYGEEADLCYRIRGKGRVIFLPSVQVVHDHGGSTKMPRLDAWAYEAKRRGILRFLRKWRGSLVAYVANLVMLVALIPRGFVWLCGDCVHFLRHREKFELMRTLKLKAIGFHFAVLFRPSILGQTWQGPDAFCSNNR